MKKLFLTAAIILMMGTAVFAQHLDGGALRRSKEYECYRQSNNMRNDDAGVFLPGHAQDGNWDSDNPNIPDEPPAVPLGGGALLFIGFGAAYTMTKRKKED